MSIVTKVRVCRSFIGLPDAGRTEKGLSIFFNAAPYDVGILTYPMELVDVLCVNEVEA